MVRPQKIRKVSKMPAVSGFKPYGSDKTGKRKAVFLLCEEYEALRLNDYEKCNQCEAAAIMQISRPTFTRIYISAREKIATAFVEGRKIVIEGGKIEYDQDWYKCDTCGCLFDKLEEVPERCPLCGATDIEIYIPPRVESSIENLCGKGKCKHRKYRRRLVEK